MFSAELRTNLFDIMDLGFRGLGLSLSLQRTKPLKPAGRTA